MKRNRHLMKKFMKSQKNTNNKKKKQNKIKKIYNYFKEIIIKTLIKKIRMSKILVSSKFSYNNNFFHINKFNNKEIALISKLMKYKKIFYKQIHLKKHQYNQNLSKTKKRKNKMIQMNKVMQKFL